MNSLFGKWTDNVRKSWLLLVLSVLISVFGISNYARTAERIYASYSAFQRSISITALEKFAEKGELTEDLAVYAQYLKPEQITELRQVLTSQIKVHPVAVSQFLYTSQGEFMLRRLGEVIRTKSGENKAGFHALRSALILAADEPGGLTLLNILRSYPNSSINIDLARTLQISAELERLVNQTNKAVAAVSAKSDTEAAIQTSANVNNLPTLNRRGKFIAKKQTLKFFDVIRGRLLTTDIYLPNIRSSVPVIVISHGIGTDSSNFRYLADYLTTYGFAVVVPNHPGSDTKQIQSLLNGSASEIAQPEEFINRPKDVKFILDQLEKLNKTDSPFQQRLDLQQVGVFGQSFGGYTALALAGAKINLEKIDKNCNQETLKETWNMSLLLQCRIQELQVKQPIEQYNLYDARVKAVIAVNPITSSIFGKTGLNEIKTPVMMVTSSEDTIAPALYEQILPFSWIANPNKYLVQMESATHFSTIGDGKGGSEAVGLPSKLIGDNPKQAQSYMKLLSLPFFQTHVSRNSQYNYYLTAAYAKSISTNSMHLSLIQNLTTTEVVGVLNSQQ
ncbi:alpha/beta hydrolase [Plectonema cf. radiosum LEGE 06105]|uniref:Alpha/beta hydrolase n=1 Tax=Plectonema cf. radiosum LEGE 06105 TaxID=945769 RepID=A0A8J7JWL6_9CYAN|nr:alpha/beta hydrolase [Plectonema radiosum]MBE9215770.1 alpha/beta hydrolase [Plectonema cf. radiosum LEGE 06105]